MNKSYQAVRKGTELSTTAGAVIKSLDRIEVNEQNAVGYRIGILSEVIKRIRMIMEHHL